MRAVFLGRFQPLHKGHRKVIEKNLDEFDELVVAIGSAGKAGEEENPLSFEERKEIIKACFPDLKVVALEDETKDEEGNRKWIEKLVNKTDPDILISQNDLVKRLIREQTDLKLKEQKMYDEGVYSGTEVRRRIRSDEEWRYLVPKCAEQKIHQLREKIRESGINYEFEPGWKRENAFHGTSES